MDSNDEIGYFLCKIFSGQMTVDICRQIYGEFDHLFKVVII